jgi:hypothetical protein
MIAVENIANVLDIQPSELVYNSIKLYLAEKLNAVEIEIFRISKAFDIDKIEDFLAKIQEGKISEEIGYDDFFLLDNLTSQRDKILKLLSEV